MGVAARIGYPPRETEESGISLSPASKLRIGKYPVVCRHAMLASGASFQTSKQCGGTSVGRARDQSPGHHGDLRFCYALLLRKGRCGMLNRKLLIASVALLCPLALDAPAVLAQTDCGTQCVSCGTGKYEGRNYDPSGSHNMNCGSGTWCDACPFAVSETTAGAEELVESLRAGPAWKLRAVVQRHRDRLLLHRPRSLLVIQGTVCDPQALDAVVPLSPERLDALQTLGVMSLEHFLDRGGGMIGRR